MKYETYYKKCQLLFMGSTMYLKLVITAAYILNVIGNTSYPGNGLQEAFVANGFIANVGNYQILDLLLL